MKNLNLLKKEFLLGNNLSVIIWLFCSFIMQLIPSYPMYVGPYYICLCIMLSFALNQTSHDILYTVLLPVKKIDTVKARFMYACILECAFFYSDYIASKSDAFKTFLILKCILPDAGYCRIVYCFGYNY